MENIKAREGFQKKERRYQEQIKIYRRNVFIMVLVCALFFTAISLFLARKLHVIADGLLLGGVFTLAYAVGRGFMAADKFRFIAVSINLAVALITGYLKFIRPLGGLMRGKQAVTLWLVVGSLFAVPSTAYADMGLPMIVIAWPGMAVMLIPVVAIEAFVLTRIFGTSVRRMVEVAATSNIVSTVVGIPVTWGLLFAAQAITGGGRGGPSVETFAGKVLAVTWQAPWLLPYESDLSWMVPVAMLVLLVPFFFASWLIEYQVSRLMMRDFAAGVVKNAVLRANLASYALLVLVLIGTLAVRIYQHARI